MTIIDDEWQTSGDDEPARPLSPFAGFVVDGRLAYAPATQPTARPAMPVARTVADLLANPPSAPELLIEDLLRRGDRVLLTGPRGLGKSWLAMQLAEALSAGEGDFLGFEVAGQARVLMVLGEAEQHDQHERWELFGARQPGGIFVETSRTLHVEVDRYWYVDELSTGEEVRRESSTAFLEPPGELERLIAKHDTSVLIIDPWAVFYRGDENDNGQVERALNELADVQARTGVTVVIVHHFGKDARSNAEPEDRGRGASRLADWAGTRITMQPYFKPNGRETRESRSDARRLVTLHFLVRSMPSPDSIVIEAAEDTRRFSVRHDLSLSPQSARNARTAADAERAADTCRSAGGFDSDSEAGRALHMEPRAAGKLLLEAAKLGLVRQVGGGGRGSARRWEPVE